MLILYILLAILILLLMIVIHELGHYLAGKALKFKINEFSVGFGPKIISKVNEKTGERFSLRAIPLGGFCAFEDEEGEEGEKNPKSFVNEPPWKRIIVLLAGGVFNMISAFIFTFIFILVVGFATPTVVDITKNPQTLQPYNAELVVGDRIIGVNGEDITVLNTYEELLASSGDDVTLSVIRNGENVTISVKKQEVTYVDANGKTTTATGKLGFTARYDYQGSFEVAIKEFIPYTFELSWTIIDSLFQIITGKVEITQMTGTVGTVVFMAETAQANWRSIFLLLPLIASNLGIFNLLPIPALDGSKVVFTTIEWIRGKPINRKIEGYIHAVGIMLLLAFVVFVDILHFTLR